MIFLCLTAAFPLDREQDFPMINLTALLSKSGLCQTVGSESTDSMRSGSVRTMVGLTVYLS